jgi:5-methylcytosine-specific restriction endonuclease McrA
MVGMGNQPATCRKATRDEQTEAMTRDSAKRDKDRATIKRARPYCHICGLPIDYTLPYLDPGEFVVDHLVPLKREGPDTLQNKRAAHRKCNRSKSDKAFAPIVRRSNSLT